MAHLVLLLLLLLLLVLHFNFRLLLRHCGCVARIAARDLSHSHTVTVQYITYILRHRELRPRVPSPYIHQNARSSLPCRFASCGLIRCSPSGCTLRCGPCDP